MAIPSSRRPGLADCLGSLDRLLGGDVPGCGRGGNEFPVDLPMSARYWFRPCGAPNTDRPAHLVVTLAGAGLASCRSGLSWRAWFRLVVRRVGLSRHIRKARAPRGMEGR
jgi:hypothetical protein